MVGLVSNVRWRALEPEMRTIVSELMTRHFESIAATYVSAEIEYAAELRAAGIDVVEVGPEFFGDALGRWEESWLTKAPVLLSLRRLAAAGTSAAP
jgi:TRAP-type C4-dicarboxylate transport system substrate-binding protein